MLTAANPAPYQRRCPRRIAAVYSPGKCRISAAFAPDSRYGKPELCLFLQVLLPFQRWEFVASAPD